MTIVGEMVKANVIATLAEETGIVEAIDKAMSFKLEGTIVPPLFIPEMLDTYCVKPRKRRKNKHNIFERSSVPPRKYK